MSFGTSRRAQLENGSEWLGCGVGGVHQQQECQKLDYTHNCCSQATLHKAVPNN